MISVVLNTYNAEKHLREVLNSAKGFDEIVVCDMESTDATVQIAREMGCKVVVFPKGDINICEPARNTAIRSASNPWVLVVDADEIIPAPLRDYLYERIKEPDCPKGIYIPRQSFFMSQKMKLSYPDYQLRFLVRDGSDWPAEIHSVPKIPGRVEKIPRCRHDLALLHLAENSIDGIIKKTNEYTNNEVIKKAHKNYGLTALLCRPAFRFFKVYILDGGWKDGTAGYVKAVLAGFYQFVTVAKMIEKRKQSGGN